MKKKILYLMVVIFTQGYAMGQDTTIESPLVEFEYEETPEEDDCQSFFEITDADIDTMIKEPKKHEWSRARVLAVKLGVTLALTLRSCYQKMHSAWLYVKSLVLS